MLPCACLQPGAGCIGSEQHSPPCQEVSNALFKCRLTHTGIDAGKSFLMKHIITALEAEGLSVAVTATTGIAAEPLQGTTLHRLLGAAQLLCASQACGVQGAAVSRISVRHKTQSATPLSCIVEGAGCGIPKSLEDWGKMWQHRIVLRRLDCLIVDEVHLPHFVCRPRPTSLQPLLQTLSVLFCKLRISASHTATWFQTRPFSE